MDCLPDDPLVEIFSRVPAKSICRLKCVSKAWLRLITDPLHRKRLPQTLAGFFCEFEDPGARGEIRRHLIDPRGRSVSLVDPSLSFLAKLPGIANIRFLHSCSGLFLFGHGPNRCDPLGYLVCNPATERWVAVPSSGWTSSPQLGEEGDESDDDEEETLCTFLLFDPAVSSHFHVVLFVSRGFSRKAAAHTYSSGTGVWIHRAGELKQQEQQREGDERQRLGTFGYVASLTGNALVNGFLHLVVCHIQRRRELIVALDGEGKTRKVMCWPEEPGHLLSDAVFIGQSQGRLHCITQRPENIKFKILIWVLVDYDKEEWVLKHSMTSSHPFGNAYCSVVAIHPHHNSVYISIPSRRGMVAYDMDTKKVHGICTFGHHCGCIAPYVPHFAESSVLAN